ncbi:hypothetical protein FACUT_5522 [Fusarium acutatum]|uniref:Uncharacterized protein n=1 Tax=Fusarium acutatum TaxID=78861 RepID=A0A8H4JRD5_9HYPO|nr:hypothetical protein FACUT_5522 [Fusarium acutatum]
MPAPDRKIVDKTGWNSNWCYPLNNTPTVYQQQDFEYATLADGATLKYDCFMPTGQVYEFLPCAPWPCDRVIGYQKYRGMQRIMDMEGPSAPGNEAFVPYKLLLYRGWDNQNPESDDRQRFVYLAENKPTEPAVGDCLVRLEEIHKRMKGDAADYAADCAVYNTREEVLEALTFGNREQKRTANERRTELQRQGKWTLRFRCWTVEGKECAESEKRLRDRLFKTVYPANNEWDHLDVFKVWAELLRKSQGDKLGAKDFFGRYWDAVIPNVDRVTIGNGIKIIVAPKYLEDRGIFGLNRDNMRKEVLQGVQRAVNAPRLKFKPPLTIDNIVFQDDWENQFNIFASDWDKYGWRYLEHHPGGLYQIVVDLPVRQFLCRTAHKKQFWQEGYGYPEESNAKRLNDDHLKKCRPFTRPTKTLINTTYLNTMIKTRNPTQDKCVADAGYSANLAMSNAYPNFYPKPTIAKKKRVAEWLHRSAFSYGGHVDGIPNNSQTANNLVLGTPDTNTVMMRYEAFVKRLAIFSNNGQDTVVVETAIDYSTLEQSGRWMGNDNRRYTWLAANLKYRYYNSKTEIKPHVDITRPLFPLNRETCLLFQSILDKSLENLCWGWNCWNDKTVVVEGLLESTGVDDDQQEANKEELKEKLKEATDGDGEGSLLEQDLNYAVQNLAQ